MDHDTRSDSEQTPSHFARTEICHLETDEPKTMEINTNTQEVPFDCRITRELSEEEAALFWSTMKSVMDSAEIIKSYQEENAEINFESPIVSEAQDQVQDAMVLVQLFEEIADWRSDGIMIDKESGN